MISGLYPIATGSPVNDMPLNDDVVSFAQILKDNGYATSYVGKWHLDGDAKPGFQPARRSQRPAARPRPAWHARHRHRPVDPCPAVLRPSAGRWSGGRAASRR